MSDKPDFKDTVFLPETQFPMRAGLAQKEPAILKKWQDENLYGKLRAARQGRERFLLHDGPPYANGDIHMGHALNKILKDMIVRSASLLGKDAPYVPGWDCHGLPIEWKIEEAYRKKKKNKDEVPPREFRKECRDYAANWVGIQADQFKRLGIMGDWDDPYLTMKFAAEARIVTELLKFAEKGQLYRGAKPVMWSPVEKTALAEAEVEYEDIVSTQIDVAFEIADCPNAPELVGAHAVIWSTTPWTIPVNQALAYGPDVDYVLAQAGDKRLLIAKALKEAFEARTGLSTAPIQELKGSALAGAAARHPMSAKFPDSEFYTRPRPFLPGDFVTTDAGTGLVHLAPDHGEDDFDVCKAHGINPVFAVEGDGTYRDDWAWLGAQDLDEEGKPRRRAVINKKFNAPDGPICEDLRAAGALLCASEDLKHSYPHSWRSKQKIIFRCTPQWFIPMDREDKDAKTLRQKAMTAIGETRWVPEKSKNRISAMVEGRPDWVISRQRAWGVPIALYVNRKSGEYLSDSGVNSRIIEAVRAGGADVWFDADHQALLGPDYALDDYEIVTDILDVWFDSGSTHSFVLEERYGEGTRADLYLEGSDQHRGWFQSSLLEASGTRGRAPYDAVLTHGFALDKNGRKMSKSDGNVVDPLKIIGESGADILRLWVAQADYFEDVRVGDEALKGSSDAYRKLRNTFRYLLGALHDFDEAERVAPADMPELERYVLHLLAELDGKLKAEAQGGWSFSKYTRALTDFANEDLSAFFFDIRKDCLYCDAPADMKRRAYRTVLDTLFHALVRYAAPILPFTAEEVWASRYPQADSVHLLEWPEVDGAWINGDLGQKWTIARSVRTEITGLIEPLRRDKTIRSSLEAVVDVAIAWEEDNLGVLEMDFSELSIVSEASMSLKQSTGDGGPWVEGSVTVTPHHKCGRCWRFLPDVTEDGDLCGRCDNVVGE